MSSKAKVFFLLLFVAVVACCVFWWVHNTPRRQSLASLVRLDSALHSSNRKDLLDLLVIPTVVQSRTVSEQSEFLAKALDGEISSEGLAALGKRGSYGALSKLFPAEAEAWSAHAGVSMDECVAFKMERNDVRAEVVLVKPSPLAPRSSMGEAPYRIVRVNNVKQMADLNTVSAEQNP